MSRLGDTIRTARIKAKMTEKALAKKCGMAENVIKSIEAGTRIVSDDQAQRILKILGVSNPISTELEVAAEPERALRPKPRPYVIPVPEPEAHKAASTADAEAENAASDAWLDALGGVVKRVPVMGEDGVVIDHVPVPIIGGKIEGGAPDKVLFYRCPDDALRGFRVHAGDLLLTVPAAKAEDDQIMLLVWKGKRIVRKVRKLDGARLHMQAFDREFEAVIAPMNEVRILGRCIKLMRTL